MPRRTGRAHDYGRGPVHAEQSWAAEVSLEEIAATVAFLLNRLPNKSIGGDTPYYRVFGKNADLSFLGNTDTHLPGGSQAHFALPARLTRFPHHLHPQQ